MAKYYDPILCMVVEEPTTKAKDAMTFVQLRFGSGKIEGAKLDESEFREYAEALLKKYNEKIVTLSKNGRVIATYTAHDEKPTIDKAIRNCDKIEFDPQDIRYIKKAIGSLKVANSLLGMINEKTVNNAKQNIASTISLLESIW